MYRLFRAARWLVPRLPRWLVRCLPALIGPAAWLLVTSARRRATENVLHVLGPQVRETRAGRQKLRRVVRGIFRHSVANYLDALLLPTLAPHDFLSRISIAGREHLEEALALGKGALLFSAHFGPFEQMSQWFSASGYQMTIPVEKLKDERMLQLMLALRKSSGVSYVPLGGTTAMRTMLQALRSNQIVLITADRAVEGESIVTDFFGAPARLPIGPVNLSVRTGAPLVGAFGWRSAGGDVSGVFTRLTLALPEEERTLADVVEAALITQMEQIIRAHPEQWVVFESPWLEPAHVSR